MTAYADVNDLHRAEGDDGVRAFFDATHGRDHARGIPPPRKRRFHAFTEDELDAMEPPEWLVEDVIPAGALVSVVGQYGSGKSFLTLDIARHVETGALWRGKSVKQGLVIYVAAEGGSGFRGRLKAFRETHPDLDYGAFRLITACPNLGRKDGDVTELIDDIRAAADAYGEDPALITIDTLAQTLAGEDENGPGMTSFIFNCQTIQAAFPGSTVLAVHHVGHEGTRPRGHSSFMGALDAAILVRADPEGPAKSATITKMKDGVQGTRFDFTLDVVELGHDAAGKPFTSCVVRHTEERQGGPAKPVRRRPHTENGADMVIALNVLKDIGQRYDRIPREARNCPENLVPRRDNLAVTGRDNFRPVTRDFWRDECYRLGFRSDDSPDTRRQAFKRATASLYADRVTGEAEGWVWLIQA